ncbi:MAG: hypothetical protein AAGD96_31150 [Chloroflexota bacterium]
MQKLQGGPWLFGHELIFECLERMAIDNFDHEAFEDEYLFKPYTDPADQIKLMNLPPASRYGNNRYTK